MFLGIGGRLKDLMAILWLGIWTLLFFLPLESKSAWKGFVRRETLWPTVKRRLPIVAVGFFGALILIFANLPTALMMWLLITFRIGIMCLAFLFGELRWRAMSREEGEVLKTSRFKVGLIVLAVAFLIFMPIIGVAFEEYQRVSNARYFDQYISITTDPLFYSEIPDDMVRLTTPEIATSIARQHLSEFGSAMEVKSCHATTYQGRLVWVLTIASTNNLAENFVAGLVIIDANDPTLPPIIIYKRFEFGEELFFDHEIRFNNYLRETDFDYSRAYIAFTPEGSPIYVVTRSRPRLDLINEAVGPIVYDESGTIMASYEGFKEVPYWISQPYAEEWLEWMISQWGGFRRGQTFDYWAGGLLWFIPPSRDRVSITEDVRYILDPDKGEVVALVAVHPMANERSLAGIFKASRDGVTFYDYRALGLISGLTAEDVVEARLVKPAKGMYEAQMPLLYPLTGRLVWYVPVYWKELGEEGTIRLAGLAIVDAREYEKVALVLADGIGGTDLVGMVEREFLVLIGVEVEEIELTTTVLAKEEFVKDGVTHIVLRLDNETYRWAEATPDDLTSGEWYALLITEAGDEVRVKLELREGVYVIIGFENLSKSF